MSEYSKDGIDVEFITIVEGPMPSFVQVTEDWPASLQEGPNSSVLAFCKLRTFNGHELLERCRSAWEEDRPVRLDYPDGEGGRLEADIVAARVQTVEQGDVLHLWVHL